MRGLPAPRRVSHEVLNQVPPYEGLNLYEHDLALREAVARHGAGWASARLHAWGATVGSAEHQQLSSDANRFTPTLRTHDRSGNRVDQVDYHPSYHELMRRSVEMGLHTAPWADPCPGAHVARAAGFFLAAQGDLGHGCPVSMTYSVVPSLRFEPALAAVWEPRVNPMAYDPRFLPAEQKRGVLFGMAMTEKQGGSDVRANTTSAVPIQETVHGAEAYALTGHKWFCSAPMSDAFLVLAQAPGGLTCFLVPRWLPDDTPNSFYIQRLKDKLGNRSNASSEIELDNTLGLRVGEEGRGVRTIIEMSNHTRLDCVIGSAALARISLTVALHHARHRMAFGRRLVHQPLMENALADLALESEAATAYTLRLAATYDASDESNLLLRRLLTPVGKYWVCKRAPAVVAEAMESVGGVGYVEELPLARAWREVALLPIWEGSGNVIALDVLRALHKAPGTIEALFAELNEARGLDRRLDQAVSALREDLPGLLRDEGRARVLVERIGRAVQASLLCRYSTEAVAAAFCDARLEPGGGATFGTLSPRVNAGALLERCMP